MAKRAAAAPPVRPFVHALIYGDSGAGKSSGASTFPKPMLVFSFDPLGKETPYLKRGAPQPLATVNGILTRDILDPRTGDLRVRIEHYVDADPQAKTDRAWTRFTTRLGTLAADLAADGIQTVVIDSVTFMELAARKYAQYVLNPNSKEPRQWFGSSTDSLEEILMMRFGALTVNVVVLAHIDEDKDEVHGFSLRHPAAPGRLRKRGPAGYSELYRAYVSRTDDPAGTFLWQTRSDALYNASTQIDAPDPCVQDYALLWENWG